MFSEHCLWSNNVPIQNGIASFLTCDKQASKFNFKLASMLLPDDKMRMEFYTITTKKKRKKMIAIFELILESLLDSKYIDLSEENLSDINNHLIQSTVQLKIYYTLPNFYKERITSNKGTDSINSNDWMNTFDGEGQQSDQRSRNLHSKRKYGQ